MDNTINFFEIAANDFNRAVEFYENLLDVEILEDKLQNINMGFFPFDKDTVGGAICHGEGYEPSTEGVLLYLDGGENLNKILNKVEGLGGKIIVPKTMISEEMGNFALFIDSEGNKMGIHSDN